MPPAGQLLVRQGFKPILSQPVTIRDPQITLGTHFFNVAAVDRKKGAAEWQGLSLPNVLSTSTRQRFGITQDAPEGPEAMKAALDRIDIPADLRAQLGKMISTGSSLTISDEGVGPDTGDGTDFITITHSRARS